MQGVCIDRPQAAWAEECDGAFLERIDLLVMAEWEGRRREENLRRLHDEYAVRVEFLTILQDLLAIRRASGSLARLPSRHELELLLQAVRNEQLGPRHQELIRQELAESGWELPEEEELSEWDLAHLIPPVPPARPAVNRAG